MGNFKNEFYGKSLHVFSTRFCTLFIGLFRLVAGFSSKEASQ